MVDFDTLRSAVNLPFCDRYADQIGRHFLTNRATEWLKCPEPQCGGLVRFSAIPDREAVVNCHCGATWCSACQNDAHWPATCDQAKVYRQKLEERGDYLPIRDITFGHLTSVKVRSCPHCHVLMEKVEGCDHIVCRCGKSFCYGCGGSSVATHNCTPLASLNPMKVSPN